MNEPEEQGAHLIGSEWITGEGREFTSQNPTTGQIAWRGHEGSASDVAHAVESARSAFHHWKTADSEDRAAVLQTFATLLEGDAGGALADAISREVGKPAWEARTEVNSVRGKVSASVEGASRRSDTIRESGTTKTTTHFRPVGVLGVLGPFNFPAHMSNGHIIPALLAGNTVVLKPSPLTPRSAEIHVQILREAGVPAGVINLVHGGAETASHLLNAGLDGVCFTGSRQAGEAIHRQLAGRPEILLTLEMGGNSPLIVWSYDDVEVAVLITLQSASRRPVSAAIAHDG